MPENNRRRHPRADLFLRVSYEDVRDLIEDYTHNLSHGGTFIATRRELPIGGRVDITISYPGILDPIELSGTIQWRRTSDEDGPPGVGVAFHKGNHRLKRLVDALNASPQGGRRLRVLVLEDNPHIRRLVRYALQRALVNAPDEVVVDEAEDGKTGLTMAMERRYDLYIVDIYLPVMKGNIFIQVVKEQPSTREVPVLVISAGGRDARREAELAGADLVLDKPLRIKNFVATAAKLLTSRPLPDDQERAPEERE